MFMPRLCSSIAEYRQIDRGQIGDRRRGRISRPDHVPRRRVAGISESGHRSYLHLEALQRHFGLQFRTAFGDRCERAPH
jgi:hypothetical protein